MVMARHLRCGVIGDEVRRVGAAPPHPFTEPAVRPRTK